MSKDISIKEIAKLAGVSKTTVSRVINNKAEVNKDTRKKVESIIEKYDYYPNARAQMFSQKRTRNVGLIFTHDEAFTLSNPYYAELIQGILEKAREKGYHIILTYLFKDDCFSLVRSRSVDGVLVLTPGADERNKIVELMKYNLPVVSTARVPGLKNVPFVAVEEYQASFQNTVELIEKGHRRIAMLNGPKSLYSTSQRIKGYKEALEKYDIEFDPKLLVYGDTSAKDGYTLMNKLLDANESLTAVLVGSDLMAIGANKALSKNKKDFSVTLICSDGTSIVECLGLSDNQLKQPIRKRGQVAMEMLVNLIEGNKTETAVFLPMEYSESDCFQLSEN